MSSRVYRDHVRADLLEAVVVRKEPKKVHRVLNLGAGTQSSVLLLMADRGELPPIDVAVFADTQWEPAVVYEHLEWLKSEVSIPIEVVTAGNIREDALRSQIRMTTPGMRFASMPLHVLNDGKKGMIRRQCTREYKIAPIQKFIRENLLGLKKGKHFPKTHVVTQVFGISADEHKRMRAADGPWCVFEYPLVKMRWGRSRVIQWAEEHYPHRVFPRSACVGCPFRSNREWVDIAKNEQEFSECVELDERLREQDGNGQSFLHRACKPLKDLDLRAEGEKSGQLSLWQDECEGMCGV